jgi:uncharacterized protein
LPAILEASEQFVVNSSPDRSWAFFSDLVNIGNCIPGCESVTPEGAESAIFKVKLQVGYISKTFELKAKFIQAIPPSQLSFAAQGRDAEITGNVNLQPSGDGRVTVQYKIAIRPVSVTAKTAVAMIGKDLVEKQAREFASCVKTKLEQN